MTSFVQGQNLTAAALNAALALYYPAGNISTFAASLLVATSSSAWFGALGLPSAAPGSANGLATLDGTGKVPVGQLPAAVFGAMNFQGAWNASINSPVLASGVGTKGYFYRVSVAGTTAIDGISQWNVGDDIAFDGTVWSKFDGVAAEVVSVAGQTGVITAAALVSALGTASYSLANATGLPVSTGISGLGAGVAAALAAASYAPLASPALTGSPTAPTQTVGDNSTKIATTAFVLANAGVPAWSITGLLPTSITGANTTANIAVSAGVCADASGVAWLTATALTLLATNGNAINGFSTGTTLSNSATYFVYLCKGSSGYGLYASTTGSMPAASAPAGYNTYVRRLFSFTTTAAGAPVPYTAIEISGGGYIAYLATQSLDISATSTTASRTFYTMNVPAGVGIEWCGIVIDAAATASMFLVTSPNEPDTAPSATVIDAQTVPATWSATQFPAVYRRILTNNSGQICVRGSSAVLIKGTTTGFIDNRRN
jgi:hypothetical protein